MLSTRQLPQPQLPAKPPIIFFWLDQFVKRHSPKVRKHNSSKTIMRWHVLDGSLKSPQKLSE